MNTNIENTLKQLHVDSIGERNKAEDKNKRQSRQRQSHVPRGIMSKAHENDDQMKIASKNANPVNACYRESGQNQTLRKTSLSCNQKLPEGTTFEKKNLISLPGYSLIILIIIYQACLHSAVCYAVRHRR